MAKTPKHPMQPVVVMPDGIHRFKSNAIVRYLLDAGPFDMNKIAMLPNVPNEDYEQFAQLIGYSVCGFCDLSYASDEVANAAMEESKRLTKKAERKAV